MKTRENALRLRSSAVAMAVLGYCGAARGSNFTWNNTNSDATNPASWNSNAPGTFPSATTDVVTFPAAGTIVQPVFNTFVSGGVTQSSTTLSMMIFQGAGYSVTGNRISLNTNVNPLSVPAGATSIQTIGVGINQTWQGSADPLNPTNLLIANVDGAAGSSANRAITFNGAATNVDITGTLQIGVNATAPTRVFSFTGTFNSVTVDGVISDGTGNNPALVGSVVCSATTGTLILNGINTYTGGVVIGSTGAAIVWNMDSNLGASPAVPTNNVLFNQNGLLRLSANQGSVNWNNNRLISGGSTTGTRFAGLDVSAGSTLTIGTTGGAAVIAPLLATETFSVNKIGAGTLVILDPNPALFGITSAAAGTLLIGDNNALGSGSIHLSGGTFGATGSARTLANPIQLTSASTIGGDQNLTFNGLTTYSGTSDRTMTFTNTGITNFAGGIVLNTSGPHTLTIAGTGPVVVSSTISDGVDPAGAPTYAGSMRVTDTAAVTFSGNNTYSGGTTAAGGVLQLSNLHALGTGPLTISGANSSVVVSAGFPTALRLPGLTISAGQMDLNDNDLIVDYSGASPLATIQGYLQSGFNSGAWNGSGIVSHNAATDANLRTALGYADVTNTTFDGQSIPGSAVIVKYTYYGDANLNGTVDVSDFGQFIDGIVNHGSTWAQGDFSFDGTVDLGNDFNLFLGGYLANGGQLGALADAIIDNPQLSGAQKASLLAAVPEPTTMGVLAIGATFALRRRRPAV